MGRFLVAVMMLAALLLSSPLAGEHAYAQQEVKIRFGALPVLQALPLFVAQDKGLFTKAGLRVEIIPFSAAAEKEIALTAGNIDGYFGDLFTPMVLRGNGRDVFIVATNYETARDRRMFAVLGKPGGTHKTAKDLAGVPVALSSNSVIHYVTERLLRSAGVPPDRITALESKNIGLRMQMLLTGQVEAATLPEPLVTAAIAKGASMLADDSGVSESQTVLVFAGPFLKAHPREVRAFLKAVDDAARLINKQPDSVRSVMVEHVRLPEPLKATYPVPRFPQLHAPEKRDVEAVSAWLKSRGVIQPLLTYEQVVDERFLP